MRGLDVHVVSRFVHQSCLYVVFLVLALLCVNSAVLPASCLLSLVRISPARSLSAPTQNSAHVLDRRPKKCST